MQTSSLSSPTWLAAYLYYNEPWENFLRQAVGPFVQQVLATGWAREFFFIRYWENGPHIRLRLKGQPELLENQVKPALEKYFSKYFAAHPSVRPEPAWLPEAPAAYQWYPNNSIQFVPYEPETDRYGGPAGVQIAERQFQASSAVILAVLQEKNNWDYNQALGVAIQLHLGFAFAMELDLPAAVQFFADIFRNWLPRAYPPSTMPEASADAARQESVLRAFRQTSAQQMPLLLPHFTQIWQALENQTEFAQTWFNTWLAQMRVVATALRTAETNDQLVLPTPNAPLTPRPAQWHLWPLYDSYIHMTNNRLGILNRDEGYLGYLLQEGLSAMAVAAR